MPLVDLSNREREVIRECLRAAVDGPFFPEVEFQTLFGLDRSEVARVLAAWPGVDDKDEPVRLAINNAFANLLGYPHGKEAEWPEWISVPPRELAAIYSKWRGESTSSYYEAIE